MCFRILWGSGFVIGLGLVGCSLLICGQLVLGPHGGKSVRQISIFSR